MTHAYDDLKKTMKDAYPKYLRHMEKQPERLMQLSKKLSETGRENDIAVYRYLAAHDELPSDEEFDRLLAAEPSDPVPEEFIQPLQEELAQEPEPESTEEPESTGNPWKDAALLNMTDEEIEQAEANYRRTLARMKVEGDHAGAARLKWEVEENGLGNHPELIKNFAEGRGVPTEREVGAMKMYPSATGIPYDKDKIPSRGRSQAERLFPNQPGNAEEPEPQPQRSLVGSGGTSPDQKPTPLPSTQAERMFGEDK